MKAAADSFDGMADEVSVRHITHDDIDAMRHIGTLTRKLVLVVCTGSYW